MLNNKDIQILAHLRQDGRRNLTQISKHTMMPISTIFDRIKKYENNIIKRNTILIDFKKLGYELKVNILVKTKPENRDEMKKFLEAHFNVNTIYRINNGFDFMVEGLFRNLLQLQEFQDGMERVGLLNVQEFYILEEIKEEGFISEPELAKLLI